MSIFVRFFALTDDSATGDLAFSYMSLLVQSRVPSRLVTTMAMYAQDSEAGGLVNRWGKFRNYLLTPIPETFQNVVCSLPEHWGGYRTTVKNCIANTLVTKTDPITVKDVLFALHYDAIAVPTKELQAKWQRAVVDAKKMMDKQNWPSVHYIALLEDLS